MSARSWSRSVSTTGTSRRRTKSSASWLAIRPAPTMPTLVTGRASDLVGRARRPLGALLHEVEGVERGEQLGASATSPRGRRPRPRSRRRGRRRAPPAMSSTALAAAGEPPPVLAATMPSARAIAASQASPRSTSGRSTTTSPRSTEAAQSSDCSRKSAPSKTASASPKSYAACPPSVLPWLSGFSTISVTALSAPTRLRHEPGAAPAGDQAEHDLGQAEGRRGVHDGAVGAVQRDLEAAAEGEAVDEAERRLAAVLQLAEDRVPELGDGAYGVGAAALDRGEVGAGGQDERLAGHARSRRSCRRPAPRRSRR